MRFFLVHFRWDGTRGVIFLFFPIWFSFVFESCFHVNSLSSFSRILLYLLFDYRFRNLFFVCFHSKFNGRRRNKSRKKGNESLHENALRKKNVKNRRAENRCSTAFTRPSREKTDQILPNENTTYIEFITTYCRQGREDSSEESKKYIDKTKSTEEKQYVHQARSDMRGRTNPRKTIVDESGSKLFMMIDSFLVLVLSKNETSKRERNKKRNINETEPRKKERVEQSTKYDQPFPPSSVAAGAFPGLASPV